MPTEQEASALWCPKTAREWVEDKYNLHTCLGSKCSVWVWEEPATEVISVHYYLNFGKLIIGISSQLGEAKRLSEPDWVLKEDTTICSTPPLGFQTGYKRYARTNPRRQGHCGLIQQGGFYEQE